MYTSYTADTGGGSTAESGAAEAPDRTGSDPGATDPGAPEGVWERYAAYLSGAPEVVVEWSDPSSTARGWLVVNRFRNGAAGGGTRMRPGLGREEVQFLAKVMELKFSISGPDIGGAKSGIDFDPDDPRKQEVLRRWFTAIRPYLASCYSTAGDLNVDEVREVIPACRALGLEHPQQGMARGHLGLRGEALSRRLEAVRLGLGRPVPPELGLEGLDARVADMVTGFSVATAGLRLFERQGRSLEGIRVVLEGFGRVGGAAALYLSRWGARVVAITDVESALVSEEGLDAAGVEGLLLRRRGTRLPASALADDRAAARARAGEIPADLCVCAAASGTLTAAALDRLEARGVRAIVCGANHPFAAADPGDTTVMRSADQRFAVVADFIANLGTAHAFAVQMQRGDPAPALQIFDSIEMTVCSALDEAIVRAGRPDRGLLAAAIEGALDRVTGPEEGE